ncbi:hypothetical protein QAD02_007380 [Eretmocerus hayati]|uniref:Uncharacterized protein n=1 Tax=Eretmocerus hayati TaxID=131215 RepID=A0ACC2N4R8_9HYME|nr:hypothetical protein QAD02_007380 [Eretmocerus hayati]
MEIFANDYGIGGESTPCASPRMPCPQKRQGKPVHEILSRYGLISKQIFAAYDLWKKTVHDTLFNTYRHLIADLVKSHFMKDSHDVHKTTLIKYAEWAKGCFSRENIAHWLTAFRNNHNAKGFYYTSYDKHREKSRLVGLLQMKDDSATIGNNIDVKLKELRGITTVDSASIETWLKSLAIKNDHSKNAPVQVVLDEIVGLKTSKRSDMLSREYLPQNQTKVNTFMTNWPKVCTLVVALAKKKSTKDLKACSEVWIDGKQQVLALRQIPMLFNALKLSKKYKKTEWMKFFVDSLEVTIFLPSTSASYTFRSRLKRGSFESSYSFWNNRVYSNIHAQCLENILEAPGLYDGIQDYEHKLENETDRISNIQQGKRWKKITSQGEVSDGKEGEEYMVEAWIDDLELGNGMGSAAGFQKLSGFYVSLPFLPPHLNKKNACMIVMAIFYVRYRKLFGNAAVFKRVIDEFDNLSRNGIEKETRKGEKRIYFKLALLLGDNLALNEFLGLTVALISWLDSVEFAHPLQHCVRSCVILIISWLGRLRFTPSKPKSLQLPMVWKNVLFQ